MKKILRAKGGSPCLKKKCIAKLIEIKGVKQFTFRQKHASAFMQRRLNHFFLFMSSSNEWSVDHDFWKFKVSGNSTVLFRKANLTNLNTEDNIQSYNIYKKELDSIYDHITEGIRIQSNCDYYKHD